METTPHISPKADSRVVWLDVVRLIAMFTVFVVIAQTLSTFIRERLRILKISSFGGLSMGRCCVRAYLFL